MSQADIGFAAIFDRLAESTLYDKVINENRPLVFEYCENLEARESYILGVKNHAHPLTTRATAHILAQRKKNQELEHCYRVKPAFDRKRFLCNYSLKVIY